MNTFSSTAILFVAIIATPICRLSAQSGESIDIAALKPHFERQFKKGERLAHPLFTWSKNTKAGDFGYVSTGDVKPAGAGVSHAYAIKLVVRQRLSDREALIEARIMNHNPLLGLTSSRTNGPMIVKSMRRPYASFDFAFVGFDFTDAADESEFTYTGGLSCSGLYKYTNTLGAITTIPRIEPVKLPDVPHPATLGFGVRTWTDRTGKFTVSAAYVSYQEGRLKLIKEADGSVLQIKLSTLCTEDRAWLRKRLRKDRDAVDASPDGKRN